MGRFPSPRPHLLLGDGGTSLRSLGLLRTGEGSPPSSPDLSFPLVALGEPHCVHPAPGPPESVELEGEPVFQTGHLMALLHLQFPLHQASP